jgi:hypothetical protein
MWRRSDFLNNSWINVILLDKQKRLADFAANGSDNILLDFRHRRTDLDLRKKQGIVISNAGVGNLGSFVSVVVAGY